MALDDHERATIVHKAAKFVEMVDRVLTKGAARDKGEPIRIAAGEAPDLYANYALANTRLAHGGDTLAAVAKAAPVTVGTAPAFAANADARNLWEQIDALAVAYMTRSHPNVTKPEAIAAVVTTEPGASLYQRYREVVLGQGPTTPLPPR